MASSVRAGVLGLDFQYRTFWIEACRLFLERRIVTRVSIERPEFKAFDDVVASYSQPILDPHNRLIDGDHYQNKFHVDYARAIRGTDLAQPAFIGATRHSLLNRLANATAGGEITRRLTLVTPWTIDTNDPLAELVSPRNREVVLHHLFATDADREMRELREAWRAALGGVDDDRMSAMLKHLRIDHGRALADLDEKLDWYIERAGFAPVDHGSMRHPYEALAKAFITGGTTDHDAVTLERVLRQEQLWIGRDPMPENRPEQIGIKSFAPFAYELEDEALVLNLLPYFHGRETARDIDWDSDLLPRVRDFLTTQIRSGGHYDLHLDTHLSVGLAAGYVLDKCDAVVTPIQRTPKGGRLPWPRTGNTVSGPAWAEPRKIELGDGPEVAVALEVTWPIGEDVAAYAKSALPHVGRVIAISVGGGPSRTSVRDGDHAHALAEELGHVIRSLRPTEERARPLHLFAAAPIGLTFLIGRQATPWGPTISYEFAFETGAGYSPAFHLPPPR